jgi:hypothetical protein
MLSKNEHMRCEPGKGIFHKMIFSLTSRWKRRGCAAMTSRALGQSHWSHTEAVGHGPPCASARTVRRSCDLMVAVGERGETKSWVN